MNSVGCFNYFRCISLILLSLVITVRYVSDFVPFMILLFFFPLLLIMGFVSMASVFMSVCEWVNKEKEHICVRVANYVLVACIAVCCLYTLGLTVYKSRYNIIASYFDRDGIFSCYVFVLFSKDGFYRTCMTETDDLSFPLTEMGTYRLNGDSILCDKDTFVIDQKENTVNKIYKGNVSQKYHIE